LAVAAGCRERAALKSAADTTHVESEVRTLIDRWVHAFESRDLAGVRSVLADNDRFVWLEDGEPRYQSAGAVVSALSSFPPGLAFGHELISTRIVPISTDAAWAQLATRTRIRQESHVVADFPAVVLMLVQRGDSGWRIVAAHTSTTKPRSPSPR